MTPVLDSPPIERRGLPRDAARLLVADDGPVVRDDTMRGLPRHLSAGDLLVVNLSATLPAALEVPDGLLLHLSTPLPDGDWLVELRRRCRMGSVPFGVEPAERRLALPGGGAVELLDAAARRPGGGVRLWRARLDLPGGVRRYLAGHGRPIRYGCAAERWPIEDYQTIFATMPGSAEMPSAGRGFTHRLVAELMQAGVGLAPVVLHAGAYLRLRIAADEPLPLQNIEHARMKLRGGRRHRALAGALPVADTGQHIAERISHRHRDVSLSFTNST